MNATLMRIALYAYMVLAGIYVFYSVFSGTGLGGWLMDLQMQYIGSAYYKLTAILGIALLYLPAYIIQKIIARVFNLPSGTLRAPGLSARGSSSASLPKQLLTVLIMAIVPTLIALPVYFYLTYNSARDQQRQIYDINLNSNSSASIGDDVRFARITGEMQADYSYVIEEEMSSSPRHYTYTPLTSANWNRGEPIRIFVVSTSSGPVLPTIRPRSASGSKEESGIVYEGRIDEGNLPTYVRNEFARQGLQIASPHYVFDQMNFINGQIPDVAQSQQYYIIPLLGVGFSVAILFGGTIGLLIRALFVRRP